MKKQLSHNGNTSITHEEINGLPLRVFNGKIVVVNDERTAVKAFTELATHKLVGFDTETRPAFVKGQVYKVALVQLAIPNKVFLIRLNHLGLHDAIRDFFENESILKAGVGIRDDLKALQKLKKFHAGGFVELAHMAKEAGLQVESVKKLTALLLGFRISKGAQTSNWEAPTLTSKQLEYAATDAWVCLEIYHRLDAYLKIEDV